MSQTTNIIIMSTLTLSMCIFYSDGVVDIRDLHKFECVTDQIKLKSDVENIGGFAIQTHTTNGFLDSFGRINNNYVCTIIVLHGNKKYKIVWFNRRANMDYDAGLLTFEKISDALGMTLVELQEDLLNK